MKAAGIIAEYNPFHNGHEYQIKELKKRTGADYIVIAMSGDFVQRGEPAIADKYARTRMALQAGADLVIEIPVLWSTASAEYFARAGVSVMRKLGVVSMLGFGAESDELSLMKEIAALLREEPEGYRQLLQRNLRSGLSFPSARAGAVSEFLASSPLSDAYTIHKEQIAKLLSSPNNILAIEYLKQLADAPDIEPVLIPRVGAGYHDPALWSGKTEGYSSATAIRRTLIEEKLISAVPSSTREILENYLETHRLLHAQSLSPLLGYRLLSLLDTGYDGFADCSVDLSNRIANHIYEYRSFLQFADLLKSRELTHTRIRRALLHILLDIRSTDYTEADKCGCIPYLRVLGFRKEASPLLTAVKQKGSLPLTTKVADAFSSLSPEALKLFRRDRFASDLYQQLASDSIPRKNEFTQGVMILP